jgi:ribosomal protein S18 acetylase RimI-like enzyme
MDELGRALTFEEALRERCAERIIPFPFGRALFNDTYPRVWELNALRVGNVASTTAEALAAEAERLHRDAGHEHRRVVVPDDRAGAELDPGFRSLDWRSERFLFMAYRGERSKAGWGDVVEVDAGTHRPLREEVARAEPWATDEDVVQMVLDADELFFHHGNARHFAVLADGAVVSAAELFSDGRTAQVENVVTHPAFRGRGLASAVVLRAVDEAIAAGHDFVFLVADDADWPKELYTRLGFAPLGREWSFLRLPVPDDPA